LAQRLVLALFQRWIGVEDGPGQPAGFTEQVRVVGKPRHLEVHPAGLTRAEQVTLATLLEIQLGNLEAISGLREGPQPLGDVIRTWQQDAVRVTLTATDPPAQLVQLRQPEALR